MNEIELKVTTDEANLVLEALGNLPFVKVYALVAKLQSQAKEQLEPAAPAAGLSAVEETAGETAEAPAPAAPMAIGERTAIGERANAA